MPADPETGELSAPSGSVSILPADYDGPVRASTSDSASEVLTYCTAVLPRLLSWTTIDRISDSS